MKRLFYLISLATMTLTAHAQKGFKQQQLKFERVRTAYDLKWASLEKDLQKAGFGNGFEMLMNAYKAEGKVEIWLKTTKQDKFTLFKTYNACSKSGTLGPKVIEGDLQTPEGFYKINVFNPMSLYHLSLGVDYPNTVDKARTGKDRKTGGDIYIHGDCVTIGCIPLTDDKIREVYILAVEARNNGQKDILVNIFPFRMTKVNFDNYAKQFPQHIAFWNTLQPGFDDFEKNKMMAKVTQVGGKYVVK
ncbi:MAG: L,D-transpeptidase family protein [Pedobacter sp.]|uniref:L,D-transpeptidase family protein n=1 Tax=Pedobacter sp. TaxID=1411316 RepID=UPI00280824F6|nr:L,D-transpeptidase family protein [Pedobacter sp.]MDQ8004723.1 L,D-transpeptidase family protein [Pedobacter sp.]